MDKELQKQWDALERRIQLENKENDLNRARSVTVGTCFGGSVEVMMRGNSGFLWCNLQPVEVVELIHQLAAGIGCHIAVKPRNDFASWRGWKLDDSKIQQNNSWAPFSDDIALHSKRGAVLPPPEEQPGMQPKLMVRSKENVVATEKPKNRRSSKRTAKAA